MPDNITAPGAGAIIATDQIGTTHYPRSKTGFGAEGAYTDVSADNPLPVAIVSGGGTGGGGGDASAANQATEIARLTSILASVDGVEALLATISTLIGGTLTIALPSGAATNAGVAAALAGVTFYPATQPVSGTVAVTGALTDTQLRASALPVSAAALPLPAGASTAANQATAITALQNSAPADDLFAITPSDSVALATIPKALLVTVAGNVAVRGTGATPVTLAVTAGQILPIRARYVYATGTTATVVGLV